MNNHQNVITCSREELLLVKNPTGNDDLPFFYSLPLKDSDFLKTNWFNQNQLPEPLSFSSYLSILKQISPEKLSYSGVVETVFSSLFYSYMLTPSQILVLKKWLGEPLIYEIKSIPFRKFRAALPWLSAECQEEALCDALCTELLFTLFYIYDDILDEKNVRYGRKTAYGKFGRKSLISWDAAHEIGGAGNSFLKGDKERADLWRETLHQLSESERQRVSQREPIALDDYCNQNINRTRFIGLWWERAAHACSQRELKSFISEVYPICALAGQLRNDLKNIDERESAMGGIQFSDFSNGIITSITLTTVEMASQSDKDWIVRYVWGFKSSPSPMVIKRLEHICESCGAVNRIKELLISKIEIIEDRLRTSKLPQSLKYLWSGWIHRQFRSSITASHSANSQFTINFVEAINYLSRNRLNDSTAFN